MKKQNLLNNKGQALVMFLLVLPILLFALGFIIDTGMMKYEKTKIENINKMALSYILKNNETYKKEKVEELILKNDKEINITSFTEENKIVKIELEKRIDSLFGNVIGLKNYKVKSIYKLDIEKKKIEKEE